MGKKSNVNPDHYKTSGRGRKGEDILQDKAKQAVAQNKKAARRHKKK